ncbi:SRPBCC domain-containing protein [Chitinophaga horti]|uniref:SRPBCC domain-containing protein n=1 Tax=Chitinophaga horti TaxID=2920382 RepID=A0ABY6J5R5_9BACT|nr:SRPBCC domain-containing protein [Chitinophaga horti]UYQ94962.1 SRPBCC domain-containing protein [Chitinophaga horti]
MDHKSYTTSMTSGKSANDVYLAIKNIPGWWTENYEGKTGKIGDEFTVTFGDTFIHLQLKEQLVNHKLMWEVTGGHKHFLENPKEWVGTSIQFDIANIDNEKTEITFTHHGLAAPLECYDICTTSWHGYLHGSLKKLIETGEGNADKKE